MSERKTKQSTHRVYAVCTISPHRCYWAEIGAACAKRDSQGFNMKLNLLPVGEADLVIREIQDDGGANEPPHKSSARSADRSL